MCGIVHWSAALIQTYLMGNFLCDANKLHVLFHWAVTVTNDVFECEYGLIRVIIQTRRPLTLSLPHLPPRSPNHVTVEYNDRSNTRMKYLLMCSEFYGTKKPSDFHATMWKRPNSFSLQWKCVHLISIKISQSNDITPWWMYCQADCVSW